MYKYLKQEADEAQLELNTLSDAAKPFFLPKPSPGITRRRRPIKEDQPHNRTIRALAKEALVKTEANAPFTYSAEDKAKMYPQITAQTRTLRKTPTLVLTTFTPAPASDVPHRLHQPK